MTTRFEGTCPECGYSRSAQILALYQAGMSRHDIAVKLGLPDPTVRYHTGHLPNNAIDKRKLKISDKTKQKIYDLLSRGKKATQIAVELNLPQFVVDHHLSIKEKLNE